MRLPILIVVNCASLLAQMTYQKPPEQILKILRAPAPPMVSVNPSRTHLLLMDIERHPPISELAKPILRLAGIRIDPRANDRQSLFSMTGMTLVKIDGVVQKKIALPAGAKLSPPRWSPKGDMFAFTNTAADRLELWVGNTATATAKRVEGLRVNGVYGETLQWLPDGRSLLVQTIPAGRGAPPPAPLVPNGPTIQESKGKETPAWTVQDLLKNPHDEDLFDYYATSQLTLVDAASGKASTFGKPALYASVEPSPDGKLILVTRVHRPYSYVLSHIMFPRELEVWDRGGKLVRTVASLPLADRVPVEGVRTGPRGIAWIPTAPATLVWYEALDGGNPKEKVPHRDRIVMHSAPFIGEPKEWFKTEQRAMALQWTESGQAIVGDFDRNRRWVRAFIVSPDNPAGSRLWENRNMMDRYRDPGNPVSETLPNGQRAILVENNGIYLTGGGASPKGDRPFLDRMDLATLKTERLFQCDETSYESVVALLSKDGKRLITRRETPAEPPNYCIYEGGKRTPLTRFSDPAPELRQVNKQLVRYKRPDGVDLSFTLYLPPGYKEGTRLPAVMWAYPREFTDTDTAGQIGGSTQRFTTIASTSHLFFLLAGYAILDNASLPVIGTPETWNNTYVDQIVSGAKAAIDKADELGVIDRNRVGVGGHSYGAFMTANLLAHSDLFRAGIARSGAYNRTLTPFGFQAERRTIWESPEVYLKMSPFMVANKINEPILLIHGEADNNAGTHPIQSERMYQAIRGNGGLVRYVVLPHESHGYTARESVEHTLYEMISWFDKYVKGPGQ